MPKFNPAEFYGAKRFVSFMIITFVAAQTYAQVYTVDTLMRNGNRSNRINLVYLSDGYQAPQLPTYITNATAINTAFFSQTPFSQYKNFFNSYAIRVPSNQSGAKHPGTASDESTSGGQPVANPDNNFQSTFDYGSIHRLLVAQNSAGINNALASNLPDYDQAFVVVNSSYYGGSGGTYATASTDPSSAEVAIHEIGHSFAGLADEYWAGAIYAAEKPNMTQNSDPATVKWKKWLGINGIGIYPHAENPSWYRPHQTCKMRYLGSPFCSVCTERFIDRIHELTNMIDTYNPASTSFTLTNTDPVAFSIANIVTNPSTITINWYLNGSSTSFATNQNSVTLPFSSLNNGSNTIKAEVVDNTALSKSYLPGIGYINNITWTVNKPSSLPIHLTAFAGRINNNAGILNWEIDAPADLQSFELEKSRDGSTFSKLTSIAAQAQQKNYTFSDQNLLAPSTYYRLKIIEKSSAAFYSNIIRLQNALDKFFYKVYQQPESHKYHLTAALVNTEKVSFKITDVNGRSIVKKDFGKVEKQLEYDINLANKPAGIYFLNITINNNNYTVQLLAK